MKLEREKSCRDLRSLLRCTALIVTIIACAIITAEASAQSAREPQIILKLPQKEVFDLAWSPDGRYIAAESGGGIGYVIWDAKTGKKLHVLSDPYGPWAGEGNVGFTPDSRHVIVMPRGPVPGVGRIAFALWNVETGAIDKMIEAPFVGQPPVYSSLNQFSISHEAGRMAAVFTGRNAPRRVVVYDTNTWEIIGARVPIPTSSGITFGFALSSSGNLVALGASSPGNYHGQPKGIIWVYNVGTGKSVRVIEGAHADIVSHLAFIDRDGRLVSAASQYS